MTFKAEVVRDETADPYYKIKFSFEAEDVTIKSGYAEILRHSPKPVITFDIDSGSLTKLPDSKKTEAEMLKIVLHYLFRKMYSDPE